MSEEQQAEVAQEVTSNTESEAAPQISDQEVAVRKEAEGQGWVPKEKYRGDEKDWIDAETFVKRGKEILPILRKNNENLLKELNGTKAQLAEFRQTTEEWKKFQKESYERKAREYQVQIEDLKEARARAISDGDGKKVNALDDAIDEAKIARDESIKESKVTASKPADTGTTVDPTLQAWLDKHEWFGKDTRMTSMTNGLGEALRKEKPGLQGQAFLDALDEALVETFPEKMGKKREVPTNRVESGAGQGGGYNGGKKNYANLPDDAKKACDRYVKSGLMTREAYVSEYDWS
jgi:hypothetical protein